MVIYMNVCIYVNIYSCIYIYMHIYTYDTHIFFFRFFSLIGYYKILSIIPSAIQYLVDYLFYI